MAKNNSKKRNTRYNKKYFRSEDDVDGIPSLMSQYADKSIHKLTAPKLRQEAKKAGYQGYHNVRETWRKAELNKKYISPKVESFKQNQTVKTTGAVLKRDYQKVKDSKAGKFFGKQAGRAKGEIKSFTERPSRYVFGKEKKAVMSTLKGTKALAIANLNAAAEIQVDSKGIFAVFKPIFWGCKLGALAMSNAYPLLITGLIFGVLFGIWFYGTPSAYYGLHFLRCLPAVFINVFLTLANGVWFAARGIYELLTLGVVTIINTMFAYFVAPAYNLISTLKLWEGDPVEMPTLIHEFTLQPEKGFCYLYPNPMETTGSIGSIALSFFSYSFIRPGENPYLYSLESGEIEMHTVYTDDLNLTLEYPVFNPAALADGLWDTLYDKPPPTIVYGYYEGIWGGLVSNGVMNVFPQARFAARFRIAGGWRDWWEDNVAGPVRDWFSGGITYTVG